MQNPLLDPQVDIAFDAIRAEHVEPAITTLIARAQAALDALAGAPRTYDATLGALEAATEPLEVAIGMVEHLENVASTHELREAHNAVLPEVSAFFSGIPLHSGVWQALREFADTEQAAALDPTRRRFLDKTLDEFRRHGADLTGEKKAELAALDRELAETDHQVRARTCWTPRPPSSW